MRTFKQVQWINGRYLPPKIQKYEDNRSYVLDIDKYLPISVTDAYAESIGKRGY